MKLPVKLPVKRVVRIALAYGLLLVVLLTTNPFRSSLLTVVIPFILLFVALFLTWSFLWTIVPGQRRLSSQKRLFISVGAAWLPVMLLILRSIDQLTFRDALILAIFVAAFLIYISRTNFSHS